MTTASIDCIRSSETTSCSFASLAAVAKGRIVGDSSW
jgi:hypothetical protein